MSNTKLKEGLGEIAREVAVLPGVTSAEAASVGEKVLNITAKINKTNGLDVSVLPPEVASVNPPAGSFDAVGARGGKKTNGLGILGALADVSVIGESLPGVERWLESIGIAAQECALDEEQSSHSASLDDLHSQSCGCVDSVQQIDDTANRGMQNIIDVLLGLLSVMRRNPLVHVGTAVLKPIFEGLLSIECTVDDRNESISQCYDQLQKMCDEAGNTQPPAPKSYSPADECPTPPPACPPEAPAQVAPAPVAPAPVDCPTTPAQAPQPVTPAVPPTADVTPLPKPAPECPPAPPTGSVTDPVPSQPAPPPQVTAPAATSSGVTINISVDADLGCPPTATPPEQNMPAAPEVPAAPAVPPTVTVPAQCPSPALPAPPAVPPVGPAGDCIIKQVVAGIEAVGQTVAECVSQIECPEPEPAPEPECPEEPPVPEPEPEPECPEEPPAPEPEPECPEEPPAPEPEPEPKPEPECPEEPPAPEPEPKPAAQPDCPEGTITPPPELAEVKEPPPPPKKGLVAPMSVNGGEPAPMQEPAPAGEDAPAEEPVEPHEENQDDSQRARTTGGW